MRVSLFYHISRTWQTDMRTIFRLSQVRRLDSTILLSEGPSDTQRHIQSPHRLTDAGATYRSSVGRADVATESYDQPLSLSKKHFRADRWTVRESIVGQFSDCPVDTSRLHEVHADVCCCCRRFAVAVSQNGVDSRSLETEFQLSCCRFHFRQRTADQLANCEHPAREQMRRIK